MPRARSRGTRAVIGGGLNLAALVGECPGSIVGEGQTPIGGLAYDSRDVRDGDLFFCVPGLEYDGHDYLADAVAKGAVAAVVERRIQVDVPQFVVESVRSAMAPLAARFFADPTRQFVLVGVTGTNGKTTTTCLVDSIFRASGMKTGLIGTVEYRIGAELLPVSRTTPEAVDLQRLFGRMVEAGVEAVAMEVSSHAIDMHRVDACDFDVLVFTNLTQDHLDYHRTMEEYARAKKKVFEQGSGRAHVVNIDDELGRAIVRDCGAHLTYAVKQEADLVAQDIKLTSSGSSFDMVGSNLRASVRSPLAGAFNVYNSLAAAGAATVLDVDPGAILQGLESVPQVPGRFESIDAGQPPTVLVDYAHTPDSLEQVLRAAREITRGRVIAVFGCGGDRDAAKRPLMGRAAASISDLVFITSDNPRGERPEDIVAQIEVGIDASAKAECHVIVDRRAAIARAVAEAGRGDIVVIAGKGHETGQILADRTVPFDDRTVAREEIAKVWTN